MGIKESKRGSGYKIWFRDDRWCQEAILRREEVEVEASGYGESDFVLEFLMTEGLWDVMVEMKPDLLKKENGKPWKALNGVEVIRELAQIDKVAHCGKVLHDMRLMILAGFNVEEVLQAHRCGRGVIDPETLGNHLGRISQPTCWDRFIEHVKLIRKRRWIRGGVYAADAHEITVRYGRTFEKIGRVGKKYGYKLVVLLNIEEERERVVGFKIAPLQRSERAMLKEILEELDSRVEKLSRWIKVLVFDRGYWGARYMLGLKRKYGFDYVTRARDENLDIMEELKDRVKELPPAKWEDHAEERSRLGKIMVKCVGVERLGFYDKSQRLLGETNAVVADEYDKEGKKKLIGEDGEVRPRMHYITSLPTVRMPYRIRRYYLRRWVIENQGFREMTQRWKLDMLAGRTFNAINARIGFVLMLYNAERILRMKYPGPWQQERNRLREMGIKGLIGGASLVAYTEDGRLGIMRGRDYRRLVIQAERQSTAEMLEAAARQGKSAEEFLRWFKRNFPH